MREQWEGKGTMEREDVREGSTLSSSGKEVAWSGGEKQSGEI